MTTSSSGWIGRQAGGGPDQHVHALAGHEPAHRHDQRGLGRHAEPARGPPARCGVVERDEAVGVDAGRDEHDGQATAGGPLALVGRVAAGGDHDLGAAEHPGQGVAGAGHPAGHGDLGAVEDHAVGPGQLGAEVADGQGRVEQDQLGTHPVGGLVDPPRAAAGVGSMHRLVDALDVDRRGRRRTRRRRRAAW